MLKVLHSGFHTTVQDQGRFGFQEFGVPLSGAMDLYSAELANTLLGNKKEAAVLEFAMTGPKLQFQKETVICITGGDMAPKLNGTLLKCNSRITIGKDDVLSFGRPAYGFRGYLAVVGGFMTKEILNSRSMYKNITSSFIIKKDDLIPYLEPQSVQHIKNASVKINKQHFSNEILEVFRGPEFTKLHKKKQALILNKNFTVSKLNNRMAYQLKELVQNNLKEIITSLVLPGTIQLTPSGQLIILMRDCQTSGGYPRILQLSESAINKLSQKYTGSNIQFQLID